LDGRPDLLCVRPALGYIRPFMLPGLKPWRNRRLSFTFILFRGEKLWLLIAAVWLAMCI